ncbi:hypothetical protein KIW84_032777 [Lathyrus oleraceus]|uniref:Alpha-L-arabinofuranosidase 1 catalytic domain-containing protein n=1 Tax=Pisum sativum TaxID=3888 RepID=A0A9D4XVT5_PEA|nr:hypothetical protein KIW84_032777 [Pisum sativum]
MSNKKIVISRDVIVDEFRQFDSRKSAISVQEIDLPQDEIDFMQENQHSGAAGTGSGEVEIDLPQGEIDFMQENLNSQSAEGTVQQPFVTETGESSRRPTRQRGLPQRLRHGFRNDLFQMVANLKPKTLRFPGGCYVEGDYLKNAFKWKDTVGAWEERPV